MTVTRPSRGYRHLYVQVLLAIAPGHAVAMVIARLENALDRDVVQQALGSNTAILEP